MINVIQLRKTYPLIITLGFALTTCNGKWVNQKNADGMNRYTDSTILDTNTMDSTQPNFLADSTTMHLRMPHTK